MAFVLDALDALDALDVLCGSSEVTCAPKMVRGTSIRRATGASHSLQMMAQELYALF